MQSKARYRSGLFIVDVEHMPTGCGTWPAFWMYGEDDDNLWPKWGEIDIIEVVHTMNRAMTTLHSSELCSQASMQAGRDFTGYWSVGRKGALADSCFVDEAAQYENQ